MRFDVLKATFFLRVQSCLRLQGTVSLILKINTILRKVRVYPSTDMELTFERAGTFRRYFVTRNSLLFVFVENTQFRNACKREKQKWQFKHTVL